MQTRQENAGRRLRYVWLVGLLALVFGAGVAGGVVFDRQVVAAFVPLDNIPADAKPAFQRMADAWNTIQQHYVDQSAVQPPQLAYGAIGGMVDALGDTGHSRFLSPDMLKVEHDATQGKFEGIGAEVELKDGHVVIVAPIDDSPAQRANLHPGDVILDEARQKGTGKWASQYAMDLQVPTPTIDAAVAMRNLSIYKDEREAASQMLSGPPRTDHADRTAFVNQVRRALYAATILTYAQGMSLLREASHAYAYGLNLQDVARIWRGGCIIRAGLLEHIRSAFGAQPNLPNLMVDPKLSQALMERQADLRAVVQSAAGLGIPAPALAVSLAYLDGYRSAWLPANLIQAQRDYFGVHTYERVDDKGVFHTQSVVHECLSC